MKFEPGDKVKFRADATTDEGRGREPIGEIFAKATWEVVSQDGEKIELKTKHEGMAMTMLTLAYKLELVVGAN